MTYPEPAQHQPAQTPPGVAYAPASAPATAPATTRNGLGIVSVIAGGVSIGLNLVFVLIQVGLVASHSHGLLSILAIIQAIVTGIVGLAGIIFGALGLMARGRPKGAAGVGLGLGIATVTGVLMSLLFTALLALI